MNVFLGRAAATAALRRGRSLSFEYGLRRLRQPGHEPGLRPAREPGLRPGREPGLRPGREPGLRPGLPLGVLLALLSGCASSPPMRYYTLTEVAAQTRLTSPADTVRVRLDRVTIPSELDRTQLVRRLDGTRLQISEVDRWAAPLEEMIRRVLSGDLAARLPANLVADTNELSMGERRQSVAVDIQEFYTDASCATTLRATWVLKGQDTPSTQAAEAIELPGGACAGPAAQPEQMSRAVALLADRIASAVAQAPTPGH